ncbi:MAG: 50S ribosomal protein L3 [Gammaproteobacteria bacterium]
MAIGVVGRKCGMTRIFTDDGQSIPVTVIQVQANRITQVKRPERDGYRAVQVTTGTRRASRVNKPLAGHFAKAGTPAGRGLWEFRLAQDEGSEVAEGQALGVTLFTPGQKVDACGISLGKGYAGTVKRHHFRTQDASHGNSLSHRAPGSIGQNQTPGRVFKGKRMAGQMGNKRRTVQNLEVVRVDEARELILVRGAVPGPKGGDIMLRPAVKSSLEKG